MRTLEKVRPLAGLFLLQSLSDRLDTGRSMCSKKGIRAGFMVKCDGEKHPKL
ncbi:MAG: hypothetical protein JWO50_286 [Candidatus Kaiserbacteria bacterium]|nr:hypothetical protein [Candidatus Kaiserbacteria bacterium]